MPANEKGKQTDFQREQAVFLAAVEAAGPAERNAVLDRQCGNDADLRKRVEALLAAHDAEGSLPPVGAAVAETRALETPAGAMIAGRYKLLEEIGAGGMGVVWMAEQRSPVRRLVAIKLIKAGMDSRTVVARFEAERQALAMMDHPNIARVFDGGMTEQERPYFVMELVRGLPVTQYCDQRRMTVRDRLLLFTEICQAVQHAHQKGIIHRDIKPSNVLVTEHDGKPVPKVIDFGLAKALGGAGVLTEHTLHTAFGAMAGTPLYTAPEQVAINALDIDTRADIYALGVLLYELLTGSPPLERERLQKAAWDEVCRVIREEEPPRPSMRISTSLLLPSLAASRQSEPGKLSGLIKGDLDWIVLKSLEKERNRRYDTATALVADIERHLNDEPVVAAPPSFGYRARKFMRKHCGPVIAGAVAAALLAIGLATTTWQWRRADANASTATRNEKIAETQKIEADKQRDAAELEAYVADLAPGQSAMGNNDWPEARRRLDACPASKRGFEWRFLSEKARGIVAALPGFVDKDAVSPDGRLVLEQSNAGDIQLFDLSGNPVGEPMNRDGKPTISSTGIGFSPNGQLVIAVGMVERSPDGEKTADSALFWNLTGKLVCGPVRTGILKVGSICSPDGQHILTMPNDHTVQVQEVSGRVVGEAMKHTGAVDSAIFSPDGRLVLTVSQSKSVARLWDMEGRPVGKVMRGTKSYYRDLAFSPDGNLLIERPDDWVVHLRSLAGELVGEPMKHEVTVQEAHFSPDSRMVIITDIWNKKLLWDLNGKPLGHHKYEMLEFSANGRLMLTQGAGDLALQLCDGTGKPFGEPIRKEGGVYAACFSPDGRLVLTRSDDGVARLWDLNGRPVGEPMVYRHFEWNWTMGKPMGPMGDVNYQEACSFTPDGRRVVTESNGRICVWDLQGRTIGAAIDLRHYMLDLDGSTLFTEGDDSDATRRIVRIDRLDSPIMDVDFDVSLARDEVGSLDATFHRASVTPERSAPARTIRRVVTANTIELVASGVEPVALHHDRTVTAVAMSPDGLRVVTAAGTLVRFWDAASGHELADIPAVGSVNDLQFTPDGTQLILTMQDGNPLVWDSRPFEDRQHDRDARFAEFKPAREHVDQLLTTLTPIDQLADVIRKDGTLNAIRKVQALRWLRNRLAGIDHRAAEVFAKINDNALTRRELHDNLAAVKCLARVAEAVAKRITEWKEPTGSDLANTAMHVFAEPGLPASRYAMAFQCLAAATRSAPKTQMSLQAWVRATTASEILKRPSET